jgi:hypothetical protein
MSNPTSNFNWQMPTNTDLVSQLPADFEVFGQAVDTSLADLKGGTTGQVLKKNSNTDMDFVWGTDTAGMTNPMTTTGDTIYSSSGSTPARLGIGTTGQVLTVAGGVPSWATPAAGGGLTLISSVTLSGSSTTLSSIPGTYKYLYLLGRTLSGGNQIDILPNNNATSADFSFIQNSTLSAIGSATIYSTGDKGPNSSGSSNLNAFAITINGYAISGTGKPFQVYGHTYDGSTKWRHASFGNWGQSGAITSLVFNGGASTSGTVDVYGGN